MTSTRKASESPAETPPVSKRTAESGAHAVAPPPLPFTAFTVTPREAPPPDAPPSSVALDALEKLDALAEQNKHVQLVSEEDVMDVLSVVPPPLPPEALIDALGESIPPAAVDDDAWEEDGVATAASSSAPVAVAADPATATTSKAPDVPDAPGTEASGPSVPAKATDAAAKEPDGSERRTTPRLKMDLEVSLTSESHVFVGLMGDVSTGGVFVPTYELKPRGAIIEIEFTLPSGLVQVKGEVRWIREQSDHAPPGLGIAFVDLTDDVRERIEAFCRQRAPTYYDIESDG